MIFINWLMVMKKEVIWRYIAIAIAIAFIVIIINLLQGIDKNTLRNGSSKVLTAPTPVVSTPETTLSLSLQDRISFGEKFLVNKEEISTENPEFQAAKHRGVKAMAAGKYKQAVKDFEEAIQKYHNAPETLIYLNNARIATEEARTIAVAVPTISDLNAALSVLRGVAQAQNEINQDEGINGVPLKVAIANDDDNPTIAEQIASEIVENRDEILGVVGHYSSDVTLAAGKVYSSGKLAVISAASTSVELSKFPDIFRTVPSDAFAARELARYMRTDLQQQYAAVFYDPNSKYSNSLKSEFVTAVSSEEGEVVDEIDLSEPGFSALNSVNQAIKRKAKVLMLAPTPKLLDKALQVVHANREQLNLLGGDVVYAPTTLEVGSMAVGMLVAIPWDIDRNPNSIFSRQSRDLWGAEVNWLSAMAYDATQALITALKSSTTRAGVQQALKAPNFSAQGASGIVSFNPSTGDRYGTVQLVEIRPAPTISGYDFVPVGSNAKK